MNPGPHTLFDIVKQNGETQFEISVISFDIREPLNHTLTSTYRPLEERTIETWKEYIYQLGEDDSKQDSKTKAMQRLK